ncbi:STAS domain-containing protein [Motilibacter deserti]|uniref:Anti-sigma factor antagonist n=1 Tax=Motilibacter deserti TaxID=2714956 RepID=A0ABX0GUQ8_9ACTN|nr:STAS domain-containing protein [Motilibacter deserti]
MRAPATYSVALSGEVDLAMGARLDALASGYENGTTLDVRVDLREVSFMDSAGLAFVARLVRAALERGGEVVLVAPSPVVRRLLTVSGLDQLARVTTA